MKFFYGLFFIVWAVDINNTMQDRDSQLCEIAVNNLIDRIYDDNFWNKIHSIEFLSALNFNEIVDRAIQENLKKYENTPYKRIGYLRCLALNELDDKRRQIYIDKIREIYKDSTNSDVAHAAESLAKLSSSLKNYTRTVLNDTIKNNILKRYDNWARILPTSCDDQIDYQALFEFLKTFDVDQKKIMAYGIKYLGEIEPQYWEILYKLAIEEPIDSPYSVFLLSSTLSSCPSTKKDDRRINGIRCRLKYLARTNNKENQYESYLAMGRFAHKGDYQFIKDSFIKMSILQNKNLLNDEEKDIVSAVSFAYLKLSYQNHF